MKKQIDRILIFLCISMAFSMGFSRPCLASRVERKTLRVSVTDVGNFLSMDENGVVSGYAYEYLREIQRFTGWSYEFVKMGFNEALDALTAGEIDLMPAVQYTEERAALFDFSAMEMGESGTVLCVLADSENNQYSYNDYANYDGIRIAAIRSSLRVEQAEEKLGEYGVKAEFLLVDTAAEREAALESGAVDAILTTIAECSSNYSILARISLAKVYFCTNRGDPELKTGLDQAMEDIHLNNPYFEASLYDKYYDNITQMEMLSTEERAYIASAGPITVAISADMVPVEYYDEKTGTYRGTIPDSLDFISQSTGLTFRYVPREDVDKLNAQMEAGEVQMISSIVIHEEIVSSLNVAVTDSYFSSNFVLVSKHNQHGIKDMNGVMILRRGYPLFAWIAKNNGYTNIQYANSFEEGLDAVESGEASFTMLTGNGVNTMLDHAYYRDLETTVIPNSNFDFGFGVSNNADPRLFSILNKSVASMTQEMQTKFLINNLSTSRQNRTTLRDFIAENQAPLFITMIVLVLMITTFVIFNARKITKLNRQLRAEVIRADESNAAKSEFLSRMSHDIRTPLNAILGFASLAREEPDVPPQSADYLEKIDTSGRYLLGLINDVLDMSKIESGKVELHEESVNCQKFLNQIADVNRAEAADKGIRLITDFSGIQECWIIMDKLRTRQIYANLISNAIKFSKSGTEIHWTVNTESTGPGTVQVITVIDDQGCGMSEAFLKKIFQPFEQGNPEDAVIGTGLGLSIVNSLVSLMGGTIQVESEIGKGSTFTIRLDRRIGAPQNEKPEKREISLASISGAHILICEDNKINFIITEKLLKKAGCSCDSAGNGKIGVKMFADSAIGFYDAILMDVRMPELNGLEAAKEIRSLNRTDAGIVPIIALSANAFDEDVQKSLDAGMNDHLSKPIDQQKLYETLAMLIDANKKGVSGQRVM